MLFVFEVIGIAVALSIDAIVVALCWSASQKRIEPSHVLKFAVAFGGFQCLMPVGGWIAGDALHTFVSAWDHWVAFALLALVAGNMIKEALGEDDDDACCGHCQSVKSADIAWGQLFVLAIATSLDALAVGFSFSMDGRDIVMPALVIGLICAGLTAMAVWLGKTLNEKAKRYEKAMTLTGATVLLLIGVRILWEHGVFA